MNNSTKHHLPKYGILICVVMTLSYLDNRVEKKQGKALSFRKEMPRVIEPNAAGERIKYKLGKGNVSPPNGCISQSCISW